MMISVLIAGEDAVKRARLASPLISQGYYIIEAESGARAADLLRRRQNIALALIDVEMADISGVDFIGALRASGLKMPIIALASAEEDERLRRAVASEADDFLIYPVSAARLAVSVGNLLQKQMLRQGFRRMTPENSAAPLAVSRWVSASAAMRAALDKAKAAAETGGILLICGEAATGRGALARAVHEESHMSAPQPASAPFVFISCAAAAGEGGSGLPDNAALEQKSAAALGGTLCFGAIDRLNKAGQAQLLHFIERQTEQGRLLRKSRKDAPESGAFRLSAIAAADLEDLAHEGSFSTGLYKKLSAQTLYVPPLRERREDIPEIAQYILARLVSETGRAALSGISGAAMTLLTHYDWPGNLAELENVLYRAVLLSDGRLLVSRDFPQLADGGEEQKRANDAAASAPLFYAASGHIKPLAEIEKEAILEAMRRYRGKISEVARRLKIGRSTLYRKLEDYGLYPEKD